jgi:hypothetical protein
MRFSRFGLAAAIAAAGLSQTAPPPVFELSLPDINRTIAGGTNVVADIPVSQITKLTIQVTGSADTNLTYGDLRVRINGKGARNVFDSGSNARGKFLTMTPNTLRMRRDTLFDRQENTIEVYGKDRRGRGYYQNWILRNGRDDLNPYFTYVSSMSPNDDAGVPPDVVLDSPSAPVVFSAGKPSVTVQVKGLASAAGGIDSLLINGKSATSTPKAITVKLDQAVVVARGAKTFPIEATDAKGNKRSVTVPIIYPGSTVPPPKLAGTAWAVIIGISRFTSPTGAPPALPVAAFDANEMAFSLKAHGFKDENMKVLIDGQATVEQIRTALGDFMAKAKPEDLLLLYFSTQGLHDPASPDKVYLAASNTQALHLADTAIDIEEMQLLLERSVRSRHTLLFFDAEHPLDDTWGFQGKSIINTHLLNLFDDMLGRSVLVAGTTGQESGRGVFSTAIVEGLSGKADLDENHVVTAREICDYTAEAVRKATSGNQVPRALVSKKEEELPLLALF